MSTSTDGILAYGYNLGGGDGEFEIHEVDDIGAPTVDWFADDEDGSNDFTELVETRLLASVGFTEEWESGKDGYFDRKREAEARVGVEVETYCSGDYPMYLLAAKVYTVSRGSVQEIDAAALQAEVVEGSYDAKLAAALTALGITPKQEKPSWLLASYWG